MGPRPSSKHRAQLHVLALPCSVPQPVSTRLDGPPPRSPRLVSDLPDVLSSLIQRCSAHRSASSSSSSASGGAAAAAPPGAPPVPWA
eukprot:2159052-Alexandrium_andersonii.AAC.1